ncbi:hypothetical protein A8C56_23535 [Niabella ginsenosidivorans]|uniref:Uncharacterized protein n=1 Tax=Niabella ginsenosidivorans TaxID=1176587 RepID=A0A1A9I795_9BACT|nr:hypothetical protein A8C56_23535 [Niabella ginsenosidivorans]
MAAAKSDNVKEIAELRAKLTAAETTYKKLKEEWLGNFQFANELQRETFTKRPSEMDARKRAYLSDFDYQTLMMQVRSSERQLFDQPVKTQEEIIAEAVKKGVAAELPRAIEQQRRKQAEAEALQAKINELKKKPGLDPDVAKKVAEDEQRQEELDNLQKQLADLDA